MKKLFLLFIIFIISGCVKNYYKDFYNDNNVDPDLLTELKVVKYPKIIYVENIEESVKEYEQKGYLALGESFVVGDWQSKIFAIDVAKKIKADTILVNSKYLGTSQRSFVRTYAQPHTTYHSGTASSNTYANGSIGNTRFSGNSHTNSTYSGTSTSYTYHSYLVYYDKKQVEQKAVFLAKVKGE